MREELEKISETETKEKNKVTDLFDKMEEGLKKMEEKAEKEEGPEGQKGYVSQDEIDDLLGGYFHELEMLVSPIELAAGDKFGRDKIVISPDNRGLLEQRVTKYAEGAITTYELLGPKRVEQLLEKSSEEFSQTIEKLEEKKERCEEILEKIRKS